MSEQTSLGTGTPRRRRFTALLVVLATLACCVVGVDHQSPAIRLLAAAVALAAMAGSLALATRRGNMVGWYVIAIGVTLLRVLSEG
ncbi:hypothetical protein [Curtobacterium sp. 9128]|uniref:hypothetical protein n=1 Tax=Curtobacterium sp. 9128 TaxID=1793722 RepID=UPI0011A11FA0|nr:hypothetical protein [Curtobacterium sp. 9128]